MCNFLYARYSRMFLAEIQPPLFWIPAKACPRMHLAGSMRDDEKSHIALII